MAGSRTGQPGIVVLATVVQKGPVLRREGIEDSHASEMEKQVKVYNIETVYSA
jgi:hypothetical protein